MTTALWLTRIPRRIRFRTNDCVGRNPWGWADERNRRWKICKRIRTPRPRHGRSLRRTATCIIRFMEPIRRSRSWRRILRLRREVSPFRIHPSCDFQLPHANFMGRAKAEIIRICSASVICFSCAMTGGVFSSGSPGIRTQDPRLGRPGTGIWQNIVRRNRNPLPHDNVVGAGLYRVGVNPVTSSGSVTMTPNSTSVTGVGTSGDGTRTHW